MSKDDLTYVGGGQFLVGVPARDLSAEDIEALGVKPNDLLGSGLYEKAKPKGKDSDRAKAKGDEE